MTERSTGDSERFDIVSSRLKRGSVSHTFPRVEVQCPFEDRVDEYDVTITFEPQGGWVVEVDSVGNWLSSFDERELLQEDLTQTVFDAIWEELEPRTLTVTVWGYHGDVETETEVSR